MKGNTRGGTDMNSATAHDAANREREANYRWYLFASGNKIFAVSLLNGSPSQPQQVFIATKMATDIIATERKERK